MQPAKTPRLQDNAASYDQPFRLWHLEFFRAGDRLAKATAPAQTSHARHVRGKGGMAAMARYELLQLTPEPPCREGCSCGGAGVPHKRGAESYKIDQNSTKHVKNAFKKCKKIKAFRLQQDLLGFLHPAGWSSPTWHWRR